MTILSPIQVRPEKRYFVDPSGNPAFWLGDTQWELFRLYTPAQALHILQDRRQKGFNIILIMLLGIDTSQFKPDSGAPYANLEGEIPWIDGDPLRPNEAYFRHIDQIIRLGEQTGQTFVVGVYHQWMEHRFTTSVARTWAKWVAERYREVPNLIWSMYPRAEDTFIPVCRALAAGLQEGDGGAHLISVHPDPAVASSSFLHTEPWLAFNMIQTCIEYDQIALMVTADYQRTPIKPVVMAEGGYEGLEFDRLQTPHHIRKQAYWSQLAGGYHVYGHNDCWMHPDCWVEWLNAPGAAYLSVFRQVITSLEGWWEMIPDPALFTSGMGEGFQLNMAARSAEGRWLLAYLSEPSTVMLRLDTLKSDQVRACWINPLNGNRTPIATYPAAASPGFSTPPGWQDALLLVECDR